MKGLTADENIKIITALIVSDEIYSEFVNSDTCMVYWNFCIPNELVETKGLMLPIMEARDLLNHLVYITKAILIILGDNYFMLFPEVIQHYTWDLCF